MADRGVEWADFGWQGIFLRVPDEWNLGKVDGDAKSGYARLDDAEIVRAEVEWRETPERGRRLPVPDLVERYLDKLEKKAEKMDTPFSVTRQAKFLRDKRWLEGSEYEAFTWRADYLAYNLARACPECGRILLLRVLARLTENLEELADLVFRSLACHSGDGQRYWSVYGMSFRVPEDFNLSKHELKSGNIQMTFERKNHSCRVQRLSMAQMLLKGTTLQEWYPNFFRKQLRDFNFDIAGTEVGDHRGLRVTGRPRSRFRQLLRPLPLLNPRPRQHLDALVWHCEEGNRICVVEHLYKRQKERDDLTERLSAAYVCHPQETEADARGDAQLASGAKRPAQVG